FFPYLSLLSFFFFNDPAPTEIYTLSLHDALPIYVAVIHPAPRPVIRHPCNPGRAFRRKIDDILPREPRRRLAVHRENLETKAVRSEEHTSELQSRGHLVCRLLLEKKKKKKI